MGSACHFRVYLYSNWFIYFGPRRHPRGDHAKRSPPESLHWAASRHPLCSIVLREALSQPLATPPISWSSQRPRLPRWHASRLFPLVLEIYEGYMDDKERTVMLFKIIAIALVASVGFHIALANLFLFWFLPIVLSSMQLFFSARICPIVQRLLGATTMPLAAIIHS